MKLIQTKKVEGCLDGTNVHDILFDNNVNIQIVEMLAQDAKLIIQNRLEKPFFKIIKRGEFTIKGTISNMTFRVILPDDVNIHDFEKSLVEKLKSS